MGEDLERRFEEDWKRIWRGGKRTLRRSKRDSEEKETENRMKTKTGLGEERNKDFEKEKIENRESCDSKAVFR